jgi:NDP-sugar pyrophosphorylase family protein
MKALVLCAGFGTRMGRLCDEQPKPLLQVGGAAIVEHILHRLAGHGFRDVLLNLHHRAEQFEPRLQRGQRFGVKLRYLHEAAPLGTAGTSGGVLAAGREDLLVHYGDILTDHDLLGLWQQHRRTGAAATILVHQREGSNSLVKLGADGRVTRFVERPSVAHRAGEDDGASSPSWVFSGICVLSPTALPAFAPRADAGALDLPRDVFPALVQLGLLFGQPLAGYRCAVDSEARLESARAAFGQGQIRSAPAFHSGKRAGRRVNREGQGL